MVDTPHAARLAEIAAVRAVLEEIGAGQTELLVFNKTDRLDDHTRRELEWHNPGAVFISALDGTGRGELEARITAAMARR
ncbi:hypothetical protein EG831_11660 [bacterium]|nr:hypothetical protein [bacterium]